MAEHNASADSEADAAFLAVMERAHADLELARVFMCDETRHRTAIETVQKVVKATTAAALLAKSLAPRRD